MRSGTRSPVVVEIVSRNTEECEIRRNGEPQVRIQPTIEYSSQEDDERTERYPVGCSSQPAVPNQRGEQESQTAESDPGFEVLDIAWLAMRQHGLDM